MIKSLSNMKNYNEKREKCCEYIEALEEERRKINVFQRELPLCLELVTQGIDFVDKNMKSEWLKSVQLWNQPEAVPVNKLERSQQETQTVVEPIKENCNGAWSNQPPCYEMSNEKNDYIMSLATTSGGSGRQKTEAERGGSGGSGGSSSGRGQRKQRRCWSHELHRRFLNALKQLGGPHVATPKQIRELMKVDGLTNDEVKSHLQASHSKARAVASRETTTGIYGPMVSPLPSEWPSHSNFGREISERSRCSSKGIVRCSSPAMSSSTRTKTKDTKMS
ncbi:hypothetical protein Bca4012_013751 [Brassica carinata]